MAGATKRKSRGSAPAVGGGVTKKRTTAKAGNGGDKGATTTAADNTTVYRVYGSAESEIVEFEDEDYDDCYNSDEREGAEDCVRGEFEISRDLTQGKDVPVVFESSAAANKAARDTFLEAMEDMASQNQSTQVKAIVEEADELRAMPSDTDGDELAVVKRVLELWHVSTDDAAERFARSDPTSDEARDSHAAIDTEGLAHYVCVFEGKIKGRTHPLDCKVHVHVRRILKSSLQRHAAVF